MRPEELIISIQFRECTPAISLHSSGLPSWGLTANTEDFDASLNVAEQGHSD